MISIEGVAKIHQKTLLRTKCFPQRENLLVRKSMFPYFFLASTTNPNTPAPTLTNTTPPTPAPALQPASTPPNRDEPAHASTRTSARPPASVPILLP